MPQDKNSLNNKFFIKHNKKRNTGLLYEWLVRAASNTAINETINKSKSDVGMEQYIDIISRYFDPKLTELGKELKLVRSISERKYVSKELAAQAIFDFKNKIEKINHSQTDIEKSNLIKEINYTLGKDFYSMEVQNYRLHTSIYGLIESIKTENYEEQSHYEELVLENMLKMKKDEDLTETNSEELNEEKVIEEYHAELISGMMTDKLNEKIESLKIDDQQKTILENYVLFNAQEISEETYRYFISGQIEEIINRLSGIQETKSIKNDEIAFKKIDSLKSYIKDSLKMDLDSVTITILESCDLFKIEE